MIPGFNGRELFKFGYSMAYVLYFVINLRFSIGLGIGGNISYICDNSTITSETGILYSSNYPDYYNNQEYCITNFRVPRAFQIEITFEVFQTESVTNLNLQNEMCTLDYVEIVVNNISRRICGDWTGKERMLYFVFNVSYMSIRFRSNDRISKRGFVLKWDATSINGTSEILTCANSLFETPTSCYEMISDPANWLTGHDTCRRRGAYLAKIEDIQTQNELEKRILKSEWHSHAFWIGANDRLFEGNFMWPDRSSIIFHNWFPGWQYFNQSISQHARQPSDDGFSDEDCVEIRKLFSYPDKGTGMTSSYFWNDRNCEEKNPFICQYDKHISKRSVNQVPLQCDKVLHLKDDAPNVIVTSPNFPGSYPPLSSCHTFVTAPFGKQIYIDFLHFDIEDGKQCEYDNITISDVYRIKRESSVRRCGNWNRKLKLLRWTSETNKVTISFQCDSTKQFSGFRLNISSVDNSNLCNDANSTVTSAYSAGACFAKANYSLNITEAEETCRSFGHSLISGGAETLLAAADILNLTYDCANIWLQRNNSDLNSSANGYKCEVAQICDSYGNQDNILLDYDTVVTQVPCSSLNKVICQIPAEDISRIQTNQTFKEASGQLNTYNVDGGNYKNNIDTVFHFKADDNFRIIFELLSYDIEYQDFCLYDFIEVSGMTEDKRYCGISAKTEILISKSSSAAVRFKTDSDLTARGFNLRWLHVKRGEAFQKSTGDNGSFVTMHSINYPKEFPDEVNNCSSVFVSEDKRLLVTIKDINLPGTNCKTCVFKILSNSEIIRRYCGGKTLYSLDYFSQYILTENGNISFCLDAPQLRKGEGVLMQFQEVKRNNVSLNSTVDLQPNETMQFSSLMYPNMFPSGVSQDVIFRTNLGYSINVTLNVISERRNKCSMDSIELIDISLNKDNRGLKWYPCVNFTDNLRENIEIVFSSSLNAIRLVLSSGDFNSKSSSFKISGLVTSVKDQEYLNKTRKVQGTFDECDESTCLNGGVCSNLTTGRFMCNCLPQYTGLFCQATKCDADLNPCHKRHGKCQLTYSGFKCNCETGYWGKTCNIDSNMCHYKVCSGNGRCVLINGTETVCLCDDYYTGARCSVEIPKPEEKLTIGQKLLKEPIWIGMIVMLNLVLFFCVSYVIRRKCGKKIANLIPKKKVSNSSPKENDNSKTENSTTSVDHFDKPVSTISLKTPTLAKKELKWPRIKTSRDNIENISSPSTPTVNEENQNAAMKLFAAYNTKKLELSPHITAIQDNNLQIKTRDIMSCGIKGGTLTLNPEVDIENHQKDHPHGILRSYTISTEIRDFESRLSKANKEAAMRKTSSYSGSPTVPRVADSKKKIDYAGLKVTHCFPEIRIINEHNCEEINVSDSDENSALACQTENNIPKSDLAENIIEVKQSYQHDSGYPSTSISTTQDGSQIEESNLKAIPSANVKRQLFSSKAKSASFYKIGNENDTGKIEKRKEVRDSIINDISFKRSTSGEFRSFESERCGSCSKKTPIERCAYSYETDLDLLHRCRARRQHSTGYHSSHSHQRRHRRRRKCSCSKHHSYSRDIDINSRDVHDPHACLHKGQYLHSIRHRSFGDNWYWPTRSQHSIKPLNSSTESDSCLCSAQEMRYRHRHFHVKEAFSENDFRQRHISNYGIDLSPRIDIRSDDSCKSKLMRSFLSDTYRASCNNFSGSDATEHGCQYKHFLGSQENSSLSSSRDKTRSPSPRPKSPRKLPITTQRRSDTVLEIAQDNVIKLDVSPVSSINSLNEKVYSKADGETKSDFVEIGRSSVYNEHVVQEDVDSSLPVDDNDLNIDQFIFEEHLPFQHGINEDNKNKQYGNHNCPQINNETRLSQKDSAYQTKQSSIDRFKSTDSFVRGGSSSLKSKSGSTSEAKDNINRNEDRVQRHLHQAALKLALLKRLQNKKDYSKDSAICTFSEDDLSTDDGESRVSRPIRPLVKRTSGTLAFQLRETSLSQVMEEHSGVSRDTDNYNTPTNEPFGGSFDKTDNINSTGIHMNDMSHATNDNVFPKLEETHV